jgi:excisionase family DNA binding protein
MPRPDLSEPLLTCSQLADRLNVRPATIRAWTFHRRIPYVRIGARAVRYRLADCRSVVRDVPALRPLSSVPKSEEPTS